MANNLFKKINLSSKNKKLIYRILFVLFSIIFIVSAFFTIKILIIDPYLNAKKASNIQDIYYSEPVNAPANNQKPPEEPNPNLKKLQEINSDIVAWIKIDNTPIDYPVLNSEDYLYMDYNKKHTVYGSIFLDNSCKLDESPKNILLHGHHMNNGSMFAKICKYRDLNFYKQTPVFTFDTFKERAKWKIFAAFFTNTDPAHGEVFNYLQANFQDKSSFLNHVHKLRNRSNISTPVDIKDDDILITLSTCSYEMPNFRTVVVARKVRENEDPNVDVSAARYAPNPIYPDAYHKRIGHSKPKERTFEEDLKDNRISWYTT